MLGPAVITINLDPMIHIGPLTVAWHGLTTALGLVAGGWLAMRFGRERGLAQSRIVDLLVLIAISGIVGARVLYLVENDPGGLLAPDDWLGSRGYSFYGGIVFGVPAVAFYLRRHDLGISYLDALAAGFPLGMAIGRIGDVINGEHYGPVSDLPWAVRNANPAADTPDPTLAYHSGGLYEVVLALVMFAVIWPLRHRFQRPGTMLWTVIGVYAAGRFLMFFARDDSTGLWLGLNYSQWVSLALMVGAAVGLAVARRCAPPDRAASPAAS